LVPHLLAGLLVSVCLLAGWITSTPRSSAAIEVSTPAANRELLQLWSGMCRRLKTAELVALAKWNPRRPIHDPQREAAKLARLVEEGQQLGLSAAQVTHFFQAQMDAHKLLQADFHRIWLAGSPLPQTPPLDLARDIRPQLDQIDAELLAALARFSGVVNRDPAVAEEYRHWLLEQSATAPWPIAVCQLLVNSLSGKGH